ncbi:hypothetical protein RB195_021267 [Necator americanus]|uniref:Uncharacterized protein n=1 Tax=Necator americanus TaxID=51031 RepID=A0ABR1EC72_NECAM
MGVDLLMISWIFSNPSLFPVPFGESFVAVRGGGGRRRSGDDDTCERADPSTTVRAHARTHGGRRRNGSVGHCLWDKAIVLIQ